MKVDPKSITKINKTWQLDGKEMMESLPILSQIRNEKPESLAMSRFVHWQNQIQKVINKSNEKTNRKVNIFNITVKEVDNMIGDDEWSIVICEM